MNLYLEPSDTRRLVSLCGPFDDNIKQIERRLGVEIIHKNNHFTIVGLPRNALSTNNLLKQLYIETQTIKGSTPDLEPDMVHVAIQEAIALEADDGMDDSGINIKTKRGVIKPRTPNQSVYMHNIARHDISFGIGPAGTGKTYLAVAAAVDAYERQEVRRILLTRPAVEAGEKLGFLPGDLKDKLESISQVNRIDLVGAPEREFQINVDNYKMQSAGITFDDITFAIQRENLDLSGGLLEVGTMNRNLQLKGQLKNH